MEKIRNIIRKYRIRRENGATDLVVTLAILPLAIYLIIATIDIGMYMNTRLQVDANLRDGVRQAAMWGGTGDSKSVRLNTSGQTTQKNIQDKLWDTKEGGYCTKSNCTAKPVVSCTAASTKVKAAGTRIECSVKYSPQSIAAGSELLGFGLITNKAYTSTSYAISETGYR